MNKLHYLAITCLFISLWIAYVYRKDESQNYPPENHKYIHIENFLTPQHHRQIMNVYENIGLFPSQTEDFTSAYEFHIGEAEQPIDNQTFKCSKPFLLYDYGYKLCLFPSRADVLSYYMMSGGPNKLRESVDKLGQRILIFFKYQFINASNMTNKLIEPIYNVYPIIKNKQIECKVIGNGNNLIPYQTTLTLLMPGQSISDHTDLPYFKYASRYTFPQWLLVVMQHSKLFENNRIHEVQATIYIHPWNSSDNNNNQKQNGQLLIYDRGPHYLPTMISVNAGSALLFNGQSIVHNTRIFRNHNELYFNGNFMRRSKKNFIQHLKYDKNIKKWVYYINNNKTHIKYDWKHVRASLSSRLWCFNSIEEANNYDPYQRNDKFNVEYVLNVLKNDLISKKVITMKVVNKMSPYDFGLLLMKHYIKYPDIYPSTFNYCLIFAKMPKYSIIQWLQSVICE